MARACTCIAFTVTGFITTTLLIIVIVVAVVIGLVVALVKKIF